MWQEYLFPASVQEALEMLVSYKGEARIVAGGTDLILELKEGKRRVKALVDITRIPGLDEIELKEGMIVLGAGVTHRQAWESSLVRERAAVLAEACHAIGSPQIRNVGTIVGNVVNAQPAADAAIALTALEAELEVADLDGRRWIPIGELYEGPGRSKVDPTRQMVTAVRFPALGPGQGSAFERLAKRRALALPILNTAVVVGLEGDDRAFVEARIALGPVAPTPFRARQAEKAMHSAPIGEESIAKAAEIASREAKPRTSLLRASEEYRREMIKVLVRRALRRALEEAQGR